VAPNLLSSTKERPSPRSPRLRSSITWTVISLKTKMLTKKKNIAILIHSNNLIKMERLPRKLKRTTSTLLLMRRPRRLTSWISLVKVTSPQWEEWITHPLKRRKWKKMNSILQTLIIHPRKFNRNKKKSLILISKSSQTKNHCLRCSLQPRRRQLL